MQLHVRQFNPTTIHQATRIVKLQEGIQELNCNRPYINTPFTPKTQALLLPKPPSNYPTYPRPAATKPLTDKPQQSITFPEMQERKSEGLRMYCDEPYTPGHYLKHRRVQIHFMEGEECDSDEEDNQIEGGATVNEIDEDSHTSTNIWKCTDMCSLVQQNESHMPSPEEIIQHPH